MNNHSTFFEQVNSAQQNTIFEAKWKRVCAENQFIYVSLPYEQLQEMGIVRYLIKDRIGTYIGTVEFVAFQPGGYSIINHYFDFHSVEAYRQQQRHIYEIGKLSIDIEKRREGHLEKILLVLAEFAQTRCVKKYLATIEGKLFRKLVRFGLDLTPVADEIFEETYSAISMEFNVENLFENLQSNRWMKRQLQRA